MTSLNLLEHSYTGRRREEECIGSNWTEAPLEVDKNERKVEK